MGASITQYDSSNAWKEPARVACSTGAWHLLTGKCDGTNLSIQVDGDAPASIASDGIAMPAGVYNNVIGFSAPAAPSYIDGRIARLITLGTAASAADVIKVRKYFQQRYGVSL